MGHKRLKIETNRVDIDQGNSGKVRELIQWSVKSWKSREFYQYIFGVKEKLHEVMA